MDERKRKSEEQIAAIRGEYGDESDEHLASFAVESMLGSIDKAFDDAAAVDDPDFNPVEAVREIVSLIEEMVDNRLDLDTIMVDFILASYLSARVTGYFKRSLKYVRSKREV